MGKARPTASGASSGAERVYTQMEPRVLKRWLFGAASLSVWLAAELASAAEASSPEELFERGVAALRAGDYAEACPAIEQSQAAEPRLGTLLALADCLDKWGKLHSAVLRHEQVVAEISKLAPAQREYRSAQLAYARLAAARLWRSVPRLSLVAPNGAGAQPSEIELFLDGAKLPVSGGGTEVPVDPGTHQVETRARGHERWTEALEVAAGEHRRVELQLGTASNASALALPSPAVVSDGPPRAAMAREQTNAPGSESSAWRHVGWSLGGIGVAGLAAGTLSGVLLLDACPNLSCEIGDRRARDLALATDIGFGVAFVGLVSAAIILVQTAPSSAQSGKTRWEPMAAVGTGSAWLGLNQRW
jgi:hypothetical protein